MVAGCHAGCGDPAAANLFRWSSSVINLSLGGGLLFWAVSPQKTTISLGFLEKWFPSKGNQEWFKRGRMREEKKPNMGGISGQVLDLAWSHGEFWNITLSTQELGFCIPTSVRDWLWTFYGRYKTHSYFQISLLETWLWHLLDIFWMFQMQAISSK